MRMRKRQQRWCTVVVRQQALTVRLLRWAAAVDQQPASGWRPDGHQFADARAEDGHVQRIIREYG